MADVLENADADLTSQMRNLIAMLWDEWKLVEEQIEELTTQLERISDADPGCTRIRKIRASGRRDGHRRSHRQRGRVSQGTEVCGLAWHRGSTAFNRRQGEAARHQ